MITDTPTIKITMSGLLFLYFRRHDTDPSKFKECQVLVHRQNPDISQHGLRIFIHEITPASAVAGNTNVVLELAKQISFDDLVLEITDPGIPGTTHDVTGLTHYPAASGPFASDPGDEVFPFDRIPDVEGPKFHNAKVGFTGAHRQIIRLNNGVFYTATRPRSAWILRKLGAVKDFDDHGLDTGINIYLKDTITSKAVLTYGDEAPKTFEIKAKPDTRYEIIILNDRLAPLPDDHDMGILHENDFKLYYEFLSVPGKEQFSMVFPPPDDGHPLTRSHPCGNITGSLTEFVKP